MQSDQHKKYRPLKELVTQLIHFGFGDESASKQREQALCHNSHGLLLYFSATKPQSSKMGFLALIISQSLHLF